MAGSVLEVDAPRIMGQWDHWHAERGHVESELAARLGGDHPAGSEPDPRTAPVEPGKPGLARGRRDHTSTAKHSGLQRAIRRTSDTARYTSAGAAPTVMLSAISSGMRSPKRPPQAPRRLATRHALRRCRLLPHLRVEDRHRSRSRRGTRRSQGDQRRRATMARVKVRDSESHDDLWRRRGASFGDQAAAYAEHRPDYAEAAVSWALQPVRDRAGLRVLDLGAGTGKLTATITRLAAAGPAGQLSVVAVEPDPAMLAELRHGQPGVRSLAGKAEDIPLPDASADAVLCGHAAPTGPRRRHPVPKKRRSTEVERGRGHPGRRTLGGGCPSAFWASSQFSAASGLSQQALHEVAQYQTVKAEQDGYVTSVPGSTSPTRSTPLPKAPCTPPPLLPGTTASPPRPGPWRHRPGPRRG